MAVEKFTPCYICWFFTISLGIAAGTLLTDAIRAGITYVSYDQISNRITANKNRLSNSKTKTPNPPESETPKKEIPTVKLSPNEEMPNKDIFIKNLPTKISAKKGTPKEELPGYQTTLQTCNFWTKEYKKEATKQNTAYMEAACNRLKTYQ
jgi:hypothetical protein